MTTTNTSRAWRYQQNTSDFGVSIDSLLIPAPLPSGQGSSVHANLSSLGKELGIKTITTKFFYYPRDTKVRTPNGAILRSTDADITVQKLSSDRSWKREMHLLGNSASTATTHPYFFNKMQGRGIEKMSHLVSSEGLKVAEGGLTTSDVEAPLKPSRSYWEGGNVIVASNSAGKVKVLIGADSLTLTHQILRKTKFFQAPDPSSPCYTQEKDRFHDSISELYKKGEIPKQVEQLAPPLSNETLLSTGREMNAMGLITDFAPEDTKKLTKIAKEYLGQREFIKQVLWPAEFGVAPEDIVEVPQGAYHLDAFIKTGPRGTLFLQDFEKSFELLNSIIDDNLGFGQPTEEMLTMLINCMRAADPKKEMEKIPVQKKLSQRDLSILRSYVNETAQLLQHLHPLYQRIQNCLQKAGFTIIKAPGVFHGKDGDKQVNLNFLNAISGWSETKKTYYYICLGAQAGDHLGEKIMGAYQKFLKSQKIPIQVYFVGYNPKDPNDFSDAMSFSTERLAQSGVHCLTYELVAKEHLDQTAK